MYCDWLCPLQKSRKAVAASEAEPAQTDTTVPMVVPAVVVAPDVVVVPEASMEAAAAQAEQNGDSEPVKIGRTDSGTAILKGPSGARAFKRVNDEEWLGKKGAWDNSYEAKFGNTGWGAKASQTLLQVSSCVVVLLLYVSSWAL